MEQILNLAWLVVSVVLVTLWMRVSGDDLDVRSQMTVLALVIFVLLPVISLTDDLQTWSPAAETEALSRRDPSNIAILHFDLEFSAGSLTNNALRFIPEIACVRMPAGEASVLPIMDGVLRQVANRPPPSA